MSRISLLKPFALVASVIISPSVGNAQDLQDSKSATQIQNEAEAWNNMFHEGLLNLGLLLVQANSPFNTDEDIQDKISKHIKKLQSFLEAKRVQDGDDKSPEIVSDGVIGKITAEAILLRAQKANFYELYLTDKEDTSQEAAALFELAKVLMKVAPEKYKLYGSINMTQYSFMNCMKGYPRLYGSGFFDQIKRELKENPKMIANDVPAQCKPVLESFAKAYPDYKAALGPIQIGGFGDNLKKSANDANQCQIFSLNADNITCERLEL